MIKSDIKKLYQEDKELAMEVANVLGYVIKVKGAVMKPKATKKITKPTADKLKKDIKDMLKKQLNTMRLGKEYNVWIEQLPNI